MIDKQKAVCAVAAGAFIGVSIVLTGAWLAGFDFDHRGAEAFLVFLFSLMAACVGMAAVCDLYL